MELLKSFAYTLLGIALVVTAIAGIGSLAELPKPWGLIALTTLIVVLLTLGVHTARTK